MADRIVVRGDLPDQGEELVVLVGRDRLLDLVLGARSWAVRRGPDGLVLVVGGVPVSFEDGSDGSWVPARLLSARRPSPADPGPGPAERRLPEGMLIQHTP